MLERTLAEKGITTLHIPAAQKSQYDSYLQELKQSASIKEKPPVDANEPTADECAAFNTFINDYHAISIAMLAPGRRFPFHIFIRSLGVVSMALEQQVTLQESRFEQWKENDENLLILKKNIDAYQAFIQMLAQTSPDEVVQIAYVRENSRIVLEELGKNPRSPQVMADTKKSIRGIVSVVIDHPTSFYGLSKMNNHDYYTFTHSINVGTFAIALAIDCGITQEAELSDLCLGALLHDLGKSQIDSAIINKPGKLTDDEYDKIKEHVMLGRKLIVENHRSQVNNQAMIPLEQHHEKLDGSGYPNGLAGDQIHMFGKIMAVVDVYDALTTERSYKKAMCPFEALSLLSRSPNEYDSEVFGRMVNMIHKQEV